MACWLRGQCNTATIAEYPNGGGPSLLNEVGSGIGKAWHVTLGEHWRGALQVVTVAASGLGSGACIVASDGICALFLPEIGGLTGAAVYGEGGGTHTAGGYALAFGEGGVAGSIALVCFAGVCEFAGSAIVGGALANGLVGAGQGAWIILIRRDAIQSVAIFPLVPPGLLRGPSLGTRSGSFSRGVNKRARVDSRFGYCHGGS